MTPFLSEDFLLQTATARTLYYEFAEGMPIFDFHCHLPVAEIAADKRFANLTDTWLKGDHYKWRAMRADGVPERLIPGDAPDLELLGGMVQDICYRNAASCFGIQGA